MHIYPSASTYFRHNSTRLHFHTTIIYPPGVHLSTTGKREKHKATKVAKRSWRIEKCLMKNINRKVLKFMWHGKQLQLQLDATPENVCLPSEDGAGECL